MCDDWLRFRVPLAVLSQLACLRIRLASAFAAKVQRPGATLAPELAAALGAAAMLLAHDGGAAAEGDRAAKRSALAGTARGRGWEAGVPGIGSVPGDAGRSSPTSRTVSGAVRPREAAAAEAAAGVVGGSGRGPRRRRPRGRTGSVRVEVRPHRACSRAEGADAEGDVAEVAVEVAAAMNSKGYFKGV